MRRLLLAALSSAAVLVAAGCASESYGGGGGGFDSYDDCYDDYCVGYDGYGRAYRRPQEPVVVARGAVDRIDRPYGTTRTVSRDGVQPTSFSASSASRMPVLRPASPAPAPRAASPR